MDKATIYCYVGVLLIDTLLCHDDELEGRRIAFIYYLVPEWSQEDGGKLITACAHGPQFNWLGHGTQCILIAKDRF